MSKFGQFLIKQHHDKKHNNNNKKKKTTNITSIGHQLCFKNALTVGFITMFVNFKIPEQLKINVSN